MVYQLDTPGLEDQAVTNDKIESGTIEINRLDSTLAGALVPIGGIIMWSGTLDQINGFPNWQLCDGSAISSGTLSGTNTPNLTGRFVIGSNVYDTSQTRWEETITGSNTATGGSKDATLPSHSHTVDGHTHGNGTLSTENDVYSHSHGLQNTDHSHLIRISQTATSVTAWGNGSDGRMSLVDVTGNYSALGSGTQGANVNSGNTDADPHTHNHNITGSTGSANPGTDSQGSSATNANLPPYYALAYIIRIN